MANILDYTWSVSLIGHGDVFVTADRLDVTYEGLTFYRNDPLCVIAFIPMKYVDMVQIVSAVTGSKNGVFKDAMLAEPING